MLAFQERLERNCATQDDRVVIAVMYTYTFSEAILLFNLEMGCS